MKHKIIIRTDQHRKRAIDLILEAPVDHEIIIRPFVESKTLPQLGYTFSTIYPAILEFVSDSYGESFTINEIHTYMKKQILGVDFKTIDGMTIEVEKEDEQEEQKRVVSIHR